MSSKAVTTKTRRSPRAHANTKKVGRPSKMTPARVKVILSAIEKGCTITAAAAAADISRDVLYEWLRIGRLETLPDTNPYRKFALDFERAYARFEQRLVDRIDQASETDWKAGLALLERRNPSEWGRRSKVDVTNTNPKYGALADAFVERGYDLDRLDDDEFDTLIALLEKMAAPPGGPNA